MLTDRQREILNLIISLYVKNRTPIGSKALMDAVDASSATIRNDMKVLEALGLIQKEHTSSGRVPSVAGYKYYVENVFQLEQISESELFQVMKAFDGEFVRLSDLLDTTAETLSSLTGLTSFVLNVPQREQKLRNFELVMLDSHSVLAVYTLSTGEIRTNQFVLPRSMDVEDLATMKTIVDNYLIDKAVLDIHYELRTEIPQIISHYFKTSSDALKFLEVSFDGLFIDGITINGQQKLFEYAPELAVEYYKLFANEALIAQEIRRLTTDDELRTVKFDNNTVFSGLTLISQKFLSPYRGLGTLALVGPIELDYRRVMTIIDLTAKVLTMKLTDYYRYLDGNHYEIT